MSTAQSARSPRVQIRRLRTGPGKACVRPAQIGDNLYFLGTRNHNTFALVTKKGMDIILIDGNFEYATEAEIHEGLRTLGLNPKNVEVLDLCARPWRP